MEITDPNEKADGSYEFFGITILKELSSESSEEESVDFNPFPTSYFDPPRRPSKLQNREILRTPALTMILKDSMPVVDLTNNEPSEENCADKIARPWILMKNVVVIAISFVLLFSSFKTTTHLRSSINTLSGIYSMIAIYFPSLLSTLFLVNIVLRHLSNKWTIVLAMMAHCPYMVAQLYPNNFTVIPTAVLLGISAAPLWVSKSSYLTEIIMLCTNKTGKQMEVVASTVFSLFFSIFHFSYIIGNCISSKVLSLSMEVDEPRYEGVNVYHCGFEFCPSHLKNLTDPQADQSNDIEQESLETLHYIFIALSLSAPIILACLLDHEMKLGTLVQTKKAGTLQQFAATISHLTNSDQLLLVPVTLSIGMNSAFLTSDLPVGYFTCALGVHMVGYLVMCAGICTSLSDALVTSLVNMMGQASVVCSAWVLNIAVLIAMIFWDPTSPSWTLFVISGSTGVFSSLWETQINACYSVKFRENAAAAFSNFQLWKSSGFIIGLTMSSLLCMKSKIYVSIAILTLGLIGYLFVASEKPKSDLKLNGKSVK